MCKCKVAGMNWWKVAQALWSSGVVVESSGDGKWVGWLIAGKLPPSKKIPSWWFQTCFIFYPYLGKIPILTNIFQMGWNHQVDTVDSGKFPRCSLKFSGGGNSHIFGKFHPGYLGKWSKLVQPPTRWDFHVVWGIYMTCLAHFRLFFQHIKDLGSMTYSLILLMEEILHQLRLV